jgi:pimeloyl-ACP methyl ester carboxylesterase
MLSRKVEVNGATFQVREAGAGPPLLLVHGFPLDHRMWRHQIEHFSSTHRVIAPDLRGFGGSTVTPGKVTMRQFADDLAALLPALGENQPVILCGLSMGGYIAWQFVEHHRSKVAAIIVCDTKAAPDTNEARVARLEAADRLEREGTSFLANNMVPRLFGKLLADDPPEYVRETIAVMLNTDPRAAAAAQRGMAEREDYRPHLHRIDLPTLVLCGEQDIISPAAEMRAIATEIPGASYVEIPGASHMAPLEKPEPVNAAIGAFLNQLAPPGSSR